MSATLGDPAHECLFLALVCDIRGFTELSARAYDFIQSDRTPFEAARHLTNDLAKYMEQTRELTKEKIIEPLRRGLKPKTWRKKIRLDYAVKSTGDGYLLAIKLDDVQNQRSPRVSPKAWKKNALNVIRCLAKLVNDSKPRSGKFAAVTARFVKKWGQRIGIDAKAKGFDRTARRVAGAVTIGNGFLYRSRDWQKKRDPPWEDAYGHPVNLAFRLCDKAGRLTSANPGSDPSPWILLDRRVGRLLLEDESGKSSRKVLNFRLRPFMERLVLKGIEENWCYALFESRGR